MKTFFNILQTIIGIIDKKYPDEPFEFIYDNISIKENYYINYLINTIYFKIKESKISNASAKFISLNSILENIFCENELKERIFNIFSISQNHYFSFLRFAHLYKMKKNSYVVTNDLMMSPLDPNHKLTFVLVENKSNFLFNINEIIQIIETAIGNSPDFFSEPISPVNPYNNQIFTNATLYNIYFHMKKINRVIPLLFHCFFIENFDKSKFSDNHQSIIREQAINKYVFNSPYNVLYPKIIKMLQKNHHTKKLF